MKRRTDRAVLTAIADLTQQRGGVPPSLREVAAQSQRCLWSVQKSRVRLIAAGYLRAVPFKSRATALTRKGRNAVWRTAEPAERT